VNDGALLNDGDADELTIRRARTTDLSSLVELEAACFAPPWNRETLEAEMARPGSRVLVARTRQRCVGYAIVRTIPDDGAELLRLGVAEDQRRRAIGRRLLVSTRRRLRREGIAVLLLEVREDNRPAVELYLSLGFEVVGARPAYYPDGTAALLMELVIPPAPR
jgi:ribosomal-protein-alanine N-acetyltransferase